MLMEKDNNKVNSCESTTECVMILWEGPVLFCPMPQLQQREAMRAGTAKSFISAILLHMCTVSFS